MSPYSMSPAVGYHSAGKNGKTRVYREIWQPRNIYWDCLPACSRIAPAVIGLMRDKRARIFSPRYLHHEHAQRPAGAYSLSKANEARQPGDRRTQRRRATGLQTGDGNVALICSNSREDKAAAVHHARDCRHLSNIIRRRRCATGRSFRAVQRRRQNNPAILMWRRWFGNV